MSGERQMKTMKRTLALVLAAAFVAIVSGCGGGGGGNGPPPSTDQYGAVGQTLAPDCSFGVAAIPTRYSSSATAEGQARQSCASAAGQLAGSNLPPTCFAEAFSTCVAVAAGYNASASSASPRCRMSVYEDSSVSTASSAALQRCQSQLGFNANCEVIATACAGGSAPPVAVWRPSSVGGNRLPQAAPDETFRADIGDVLNLPRSQLDAKFSDPDGDALNYSAHSSSSTVASASISSSGLRIVMNAAGNATISVTATDPGGLSATWRLRVTVVNQSSPTLYYGALSSDLLDCRSNADGLVRWYYFWAHE